MQHIQDLKINLLNKKTAVFLPYKVRELISSLEDEGVNIKIVETAAHDFYDTCVQYLEKWCIYFQDLDVFQWVLLKQIPDWSDVQKSMDFVAKKGFFDLTLDTELFDEFTCVLKYVTSDKISSLD
ncbi:hypothetical protein C0J52_02742 [Blattella germanica]|nr:hypothetical protein C0J52_02742 [Blattella germanica]